MRRAGDSDEREGTEVFPGSADMRGVFGGCAAAGICGLYTFVRRMGRTTSGMDPWIDNVGWTKRPKGLFLMHN